jgi:hypothetical protein
VKESVVLSWITLDTAPALSVRVGAVCTGVILWLRCRMAAESLQ